MFYFFLKKMVKKYLQNSTEKMPTSRLKLETLEGNFSVFSNSS